MDLNRSFWCQSFDSWSYPSRILCKHRQSQNKQRKQLFWYIFIQWYTNRLSLNKWRKREDEFWASGVTLPPPIHFFEMCHTHKDNWPSHHMCPSLKAGVFARPRLQFISVSSPRWGGLFLLSGAENQASATKMGKILYGVVMVVALSVVGKVWDHGACEIVVFIFHKQNDPFALCGFSQLAQVQQVQLRVAGDLLQQFPSGMLHQYQCLLYWKSKYVVTHARLLQWNTPKMWSQV